MPFATRADLLARANARRLAQLAVPADQEMLPLEVLRAALEGADTGSLGLTAAQDATLADALLRIDRALADADALLISYGVPEAVTNTLLARLACNVAMYYLQSAEQLSKEDAAAYEGVLRLLKQHKLGELDLTPGSSGGSGTGAVIDGDMVLIESAPSRYGQGYAGNSLGGFSEAAQ